MFALAWFHVECAASQRARGFSHVERHATIRGLRRGPLIYAFSRCSSRNTGLFMLLPRFSIRALLMIITASAVAFLIIGMGLRGQHWAWGASLGIISVAVTALVHAAWFSVIWFFGLLGSPRESHREQAGKH
jgi:hypothetical protein